MQAGGAHLHILGLVRANTLPCLHFTAKNLLHSVGSGKYRVLFVLRISINQINIRNGVQTI